MKSTTYLSLGSNLSDKLQNLKNAVNAIEQEIGIVSKISSIYATPALGFEGNEFYNICIEVKTELNSSELLDKILAMEIELGRIRNARVGYQNRVIDIDVILFQNEVLVSKSLIIPHPRAIERNFVLYPLNEIAKDTVFPNTKNTIQQLLELCKDTSKIEKTDQKIR
ncbi:2-amino-4-hydroxy-6-hydroxymethyldihydropteridine diphosphokinase [Flavicella sediminum]|uniref:2-amino-4-hydroxy-6- hydroxymethyldihydropteridine diphosphokinase n=1 Tax=Flavicella sediminum TaxID=2585141 RepID=UPI001120B58D|nr:2-amino-4-hydroxy-6-hydroxymethyldihydropteridine diphosphokinase [Flavicella sediminum]